MLKQSSIRRIIVASTALLIIGIIYLFPTNKEKNNEIPQELEYQEIDKRAIYLLDQNDYVARTTMVLKESDTIQKAKEIIEALTINGEKKDYIPNGFKPIIPENTKVKDITLKDSVLKIDFSKELLNVLEGDEERMIEAIIFSLTEDQSIKKVIIFVEGNLLTKLPKSEKKLPASLDRSYGVNKIYDISSFTGTTKTTVYYISKYKENYYYVPVTKITNSDKEKIEVIIDSLKSSPLHQTNLMSYLQTSAELLNYDLLENSVSLSFNNFIFDDLESKNIKEEVKYSISLSIKDNYNIDNIIFKVDGQNIDSFEFT